MSAPPQEQGAPIEDRRQLVEHLEAGCKPRPDWRIGTEHEKFAFTWDDLKPLPYEGERSIRELLEALERQFGWQPVYEDGRPLALLKDGCSITLEPGGQFELSGAPLETLHQTCDEVHTHLAQVKQVCEPLGIGMLGLGFAPTWSRADVQEMPKARSDIMRRYMPKVGSLGLDMMHRTCTVQVNLDFADERDMVRKFRVSLALQPLATALFANSPFTEGRPNGFLSYRSHIWTDTDPDRCGILPFVFEPGMGFERYVEHVLDVPMYFVYRDGRYIDAAGQSFRDFLEGRLPALSGEKPLLTDHLTTLFPEVRLKRYLEMRGADGGPWNRLCALPAFWVGLLYDETALSACEDLIAGWSHEDHAFLRAEVPRRALATPFRGRPLLALAREIVALAEQGLRRRAMAGRVSPDETEYLTVLQEETVETGQTPAEGLLEAYTGNLEALFRECAY
jgi:glutamate--cysteine ligase